MERFIASSFTVDRPVPNAESLDKVRPRLPQFLVFRPRAYGMGSVCRYGPWPSC